MKLNLLKLAPVVLLLGTGNSAGAASQSQRTLTVVIKFGANQQVETFSYHSTRF